MTHQPMWVISCHFLDLDYCYKFTYLMADSADPDLLASSEAVIWIYAFAKAEYIQLSRTRVNDTSALVGYFMPSPRERVKRHEELLGDRKER